TLGSIHIVKHPFIRTERFMEVHGMVNTGTLQAWRNITQTMWTKRRGHQGKVRIESSNGLMQRDLIDFCSNTVMGADIVRIRRCFRLRLEWILRIDRANFHMTITSERCTDIFRNKLNNLFDKSEERRVGKECRCGWS